MVSENEYAIECLGLAKNFNGFSAVDSIDLKIKKGEIFGFLGPNGAGKTTTIRILTTLLRPNKGKAKVASYDLVAESALVRSRVGVVPQEFALFRELSAMENLWYIGKLYGMSEEKIKEKSEELLKIVQLYDKRDFVSGSFSGGMKQRLSIAAGLLQEPEILFMDEPTTGLDPQSRIAIRELAKKLNKSGITIVYTTHDMEEADKLCERIAIMDKGKIIAQGTPSELKGKFGSGRVVEITLESNVEKLAKELKELINAKSVSTHDKTIHLHIRGNEGETIAKIFAYMKKIGTRVVEFRVSEPSLEEIFIDLTKKDIRD